jgi:hypothetical protein
MEDMVKEGDSKGFHCLKGFVNHCCIFSNFFQPPATKASKAPRGRAGKATKPANTPAPTPQTEQVSSSLYHGTVVPAKEFVVTKDVKALHTAIGTFLSNSIQSYNI